MRHRGTLDTERETPSARTRAAYAIALGSVGGVLGCLLLLALIEGEGMWAAAAGVALAAAALATRQLLQGEDAYVDSLRRATITDSLTGLLNRRGFQERMELELARAGRDGHSMVLMVADVDNFKEINDRLGHLGGDMTLERLAGVISRITRDSDAVARLGGDEFAFILPNTSADQALFMADRIRRAIERSFTGTAASVTISLGAAEYPAHGRTAEELLDLADKALYESKALGRNRATFCGAMPEPGNAAAPV
jgi:diguanylate cyclase (GGDEF)-like protein